MTTKRTLWRCPRCNELKPTRHESVIRHIGRKHGSLGEPVSVTTGETRNQMLARGSLAPVKKSFLRKSGPDPVFSDNSSNIDSDYKIEQIKGSKGFSDLFDRAITLKQLELAKETNQKAQNIIYQNSTIIATLAEIKNEIYRLKGSCNNNSAGDFA
jgi:hypothetical protein